MGRETSVVFNGTTTLGEAIVILIGYAADDWSLVQRMIQVHLLAKSMTRNEIACELICTLLTNYGISPN